jgi:S1-C subfamily serine protease
MGRATPIGRRPPLASITVDSGPFGLGDFPDDFEPEETDLVPPARGWLPPEDRLWRHPSEIGHAAQAAAQGHPGLRWTALAAGAASVAVVTALSMAVTGGSTHTLRATDTSVAVGPDVVKMVDAVAPSLVALVPAGSGDHERATGAVLPGGELVVTAATAMAEGEHLTVVSGSGRRLPGVVTGVDDRAGIAVVRLTQRLSAGSFADETVTPQQLAVAACRCGSPTAASAPPDVALGMIRTVGTPGLEDGGPALLDAIEAEIPLGPSALGSVLLDDSGRVLGILDGERNAGGDTYGYFVPSAVALPMADQLATHDVGHGWLGVVGRDDGGAGAVVLSVVPGSPAAGAGVRPGDVVEAVDSHPIASLADLEARLYVSRPGTALQLTVLRAGSVETMTVTVAPYPS